MGEGRRMRRTTGRAQAKHFVAKGHKEIGTVRRRASLLMAAETILIAVIASLVAYCLSQFLLGAYEGEIRNMGQFGIGEALESAGQRSRDEDAPADGLSPLHIDCLSGQDGS